MTSRFHRAKDLPVEHQLAPGTPLCAGCGGLHALKEAYDVWGKNTVVVNAAGCMTLLASYPYTPFSGSWLYTAMASAPAGAQGIRDALDLLQHKGRLPANGDLSVVCLAGDGSASGMGLSATSAAIDRRLDFLYFCYDNEGYGNTGQQYSATTPHGAVTATSVVPPGYLGFKKDLFGIWAAHRPTYVATVCASEPLDLMRKLERAKALRGPRLILALAPCPTGWDFDPAESARIGKLAVDSGFWPLKEYVDGRILHTKVPRPRVPVATYLERQGRFRHLFEPKRNDAVLNELQASVDEYWAGLQGATAP